MEEGYLKEVKDLAPITTEKRLWQGKNLSIAAIVGVVIIIIEFIAVIFFNFSLLNSIVLAAVMILIYAVILFFLLEPGLLREIRLTRVQTFEKPIVQTIEKPIIKEVVVEKPVPYRQEVIREVEKPVYITTPRRSLNIPKYEYVASNIAKVYHKRTCRLGKLIKKKYREHSNFESFFKKKKYIPCKVCIKKK